MDVYYFWKYNCVEYTGFCMDSACSGNPVHVNNVTTNSLNVTVTGYCCNSTNCNSQFLSNLPFCDSSIFGTTTKATTLATTTPQTQISTTTISPTTTSQTTRNTMETTMPLYKNSSVISNTTIKTTKIETLPQVTIVLLLTIGALLLNTFSE